MKNQQDMNIDDGKLKQTPQDLEYYHTPIQRKEMRTFIINGTQHKNYANNSIKTAKYNM
jgi:hypothetical protein